VDLSSRVAIVTGGANGIGEATAERLAELGANVAVLDVDGRGTEVAERLRQNHSDVRFYPCDVGDDRAVVSVFAEIMARWQHIDILVNNAGVTLPKGFEATSTEEWDAVQRVNLRALFVTMRAAAAELRRASGSIVNVASFHAQATLERFAAYAASKSGVLGLTRSAALDLAPANVRVNAVCPGIIETAMWQEWLASVDNRDDVVRKVLELQPLGRIGHPRDVANAVAFLVSSEAAYITGTVLYVDGGVTARLSHV
jgi:NAD(P)-dependent dehydrogenase (short-subunit alcohol dehydrogenase family)